MKMRIRVTLHEEDELEVTEATSMEVEVPNFEAFTGPDTFGEVFDQYEQTALDARNGMMKAVTEKYLNELAKKNAVRERGGKIIEKPNDYGIDAEIGRLEVPTFEIKKGSQKVFSTEGKVFPETGSREHFRTVCFRELAVFSPCEESYRKSAQMLNRALRRKEGQQVQARTIANLVEREGEAIAVCVENKAKTILKCHNFTEAGVPKGETSAYSLLGHESDLFKERVTQAGKELNDILSKERQIDVESLQGTFEDPTQVKALISVDDVRMSRNRKPLAGKEDRPLQKRKNG